jgi:hypothetical protein
VTPRLARASAKAEAVQFVADLRVRHALTINFDGHRPKRVLVNIIGE